MPSLSNNQSSPIGGGRRNKVATRHQHQQAGNSSPVVMAPPPQSSPKGGTRQSPVRGRQQQHQQQRVSPQTTMANASGGGGFTDHSLPQHQQHHQRHVAGSHFGQQHHSSRPSAWVIPFRDEEFVAPARPPPIASVVSSSSSSSSGEEDDSTPFLISEDGDYDCDIGNDNGNNKYYTLQENPMAITPERPTPCTSNKRRIIKLNDLVTASASKDTVTNTNGCGGAVVLLNRGLHNSHRKTKLHHITPLRHSSTEQNPFSSSSDFQQQQGQQFHGNGVVLDLTSLFSSPPPPIDVNAPPAAASPVPLNNYNAPTPPPWKRNRGASSPAPTGGVNNSTSPKSNNASTTAATMDQGDNTSIVHALSKEDLQWDTKSQTTQEALITERQCQALTQWLNFVLVGEEQENEDPTAPSTGGGKRRKGKGGHDDATTIDDVHTIRSRATTPSLHHHDARSRVTTPTYVRGAGGRSVASNSRAAATKTTTTTPTSQHQGQKKKRPTTPLSSRVGGGRSVVTTATTPSSTPLVTEATATPRGGANASGFEQQQQQRRRRHRRLSMFQYAESYEHAQDQAHHWFTHSPQWKELRRRIRCELASGKLTLRDDRNLYANVGCRDILLELFTSYKPAWLTLALEVVMNDQITPPRGRTLPTIKQLKQFIINRVLMDTRLLSKYTQGRGTGTPSGKFEQAFQSELQPLQLYRILVLVFFLDRAAVKFQAQNKNNQLLSNLFLAKSKVKSTAQVLVMICREFLSRQGDIIKQLARVNLHVYYKQHRLDEIEYPIVNFAVDLRDGVRLCRIVEVLWLLPRRQGGTLLDNRQNSGGGIDNAIKYPLLHQLRIPAISRLQKIHNVNVALTALQDQCRIGLPIDLQAHHIVDGQRRMVMALVWTIVLMHCFENTDLLTREQVEEEIAKAIALRRHHCILQERQRQRLRQEQQQQAPSVHFMEGEPDENEGMQHTSSNQQPMLSLARSTSHEEDEESKSSLADMPVIQQWKEVLFQWCQEVCTLVEEQKNSSISLSDEGAHRAKKTTPLEQWTTTDLANGKALCCLIHHYHPSILPLEELRLASRVVDGPPVRIQTNSAVTLTGRFRHMRHQRRSPNIAPDYYMRLAQRRLTEIGGIPPMMSLPNDKNLKGHQRKKRSMSTLGDEKCILVFLYHVCARLIESRHQVQAVIFVQQRYRYLRMVTLWRRKLEAAATILEAWRENRMNYYINRRRKYKWAADVIGEFVSRNFCKLLLLQEKRLSRELEKLAITPIQALVRRYLSNIHLHSMLERQASAIKIQTKFRQFHEYNTYKILLLEIKPASIVVQRHWRGFVERRKHGAIIDATIKLQTFLRVASVVRRLQAWHASATCIQRIWRGFWVQFQYQMDILDIVAVQCFVRKQQAILCATTRAHAVIVLQRQARKFLAMQLLKRKRQEMLAAIMIQKTIRRFLAILEVENRLIEIAINCATCVIQRSWRRAVFLRERADAALKIQSNFRMWKALSHYAKELSAWKIQTCFRRWSALCHYSRELGALKIQTCFRRWAALSKYSRELGAIKIQTCFRRWAALTMYSRERGAMKIQTSFRRWAALSNYSRERGAMKIQTCFRRWAAQSGYSAKLASCIVLQTHWRKYEKRNKFCVLVKKVITVQSCSRRWKGVVKANRRKAAVLIVQKCARRWVAIRLATAMKKGRDDTIRCAIICQALTRRNLGVASWKKIRRSICAIQAKWRRCWLAKVFKRKQELVSALSTCELSFQKWQKGSFKIVPRTRQVVLLSKQTIARCGKKRIILSNASTWVVPWRGHRQKLFHHRSHVKAVRLKYHSGVQLRHLPRRPITLKMLRTINEAAMRLQAPWTYSHLKRCSVRAGRQVSKEKFARIHTKRRTSCARKLLTTTISSTVRRITNGEDSNSPTKYRQDINRIHSTESRIQRQLRTPTRRLLLNVSTSRMLNLMDRDITLPLGNKSSVQLFEDPFKKRIQSNSAAKMVQKYWRRFAAKRHLRLRLADVVTIQSAVRRHLAKQLCGATRAIVVVMQATVRGFLARQQLKTMQKNATTLQRHWRGASSRSKFNAIICDYRRVVAEIAAAMKIQSATRGHMVRRELTYLHDCAVVIQKRARGYRERVQFKADIQSIVTAQCAVRRWSARKQMQSLRLEEWERVQGDSAVRIQAAWRSFNNRLDFMFTILCLTKIQAWWRPIAQKRAFQRVVMGIVSMQALARGASVRRHIRRELALATTNQSPIRALLSRRRGIAAVSIQRCVRGFLARQQLKLEDFAALEIQRIWRGYDDASGYIYVLVSAIKIQSFCRMAKAKKVRQGLLLEKLQEKLYEYGSAQNIKSLCRRMSAQLLASEALKLRNHHHESAVKIQSLWRGALARECASELARSIIEEEMLLQEQEREAFELTRSILEEEATVKLQSFARMLLARKLRALELARMQKVASPPKVSRVAKKPTPEPLCFPARLEFTAPKATKAPSRHSPKGGRNQKSPRTPRKTTKQKIAALSPRADAELHRRLSLSQGLVRGFLARRQSNPELREVQVLIKEAELRSRLHPSMRLGARMEKALQVLSKSRSLTEIMNVVCTIELATRFSRECCAEFVQAGATQILVSLLYDLNKSLPHVELLYYLMRTLLNVCKYRSMVEQVATVETAKAFLHLIRMYGSEDAVFCSAVSLLEVCAAQNEAVRALIASPHSRKRMEGICQQWERKLHRRLALESPSSGLSTPQRLSRGEAPSHNVYTPQFMSKRNKAKTDMLILGISYDLQNGVTTFRQVLSRTI